MQIWHHSLPREKIDNETQSVSKKGTIGKLLELLQLTDC